MKMSVLLLIIKRSSDALLNPVANRLKLDDGLWLSYINYREISSGASRSLPELHKRHPES